MRALVAIRLSHAYLRPTERARSAARRCNLICVWLELSCDARFAVRLLDEATSLIRIRADSTELAVGLRPAVAANDARKPLAVVVFALGADFAVRFSNTCQKRVVHVLSETAQNAGSHVLLLHQRVVRPCDAAFAVNLGRALGLVGVLAFAAYFA